MSSKKLNAVEMKRRGAEQIYQRTRKMSRTQELSYWARRNEQLRLEQTQIPRKNNLKRKAG